MRWILTKDSQKILTGCGIAFSLVVAIFYSVHAGAQGSSSISQGYETSESAIAEGSLVSFEKGMKTQVQLANTDRVNELAGVAASQSLIELDSGQRRVQVAISGVTRTLVSDINGEVKNGDKITASPINGVGMRTLASMPVVGTAQADLDSVEIVERQVKDRSGKIETVKVGAVPMQVDVSYFVSPQEEGNILPAFLRQLANSIAGKEVPVVRIVLAMIILVLGFVSIGVMLYASVRSSIISIGRNPLSEGAVQKSLFSVAAVAAVILLVMLSAVYLVLTV